MNLFEARPALSRFLGPDKLTRGHELRLHGHPDGARRAAGRPGAGARHPRLLLRLRHLPAAAAARPVDLGAAPHRPPAACTSTAATPWTTRPSGCAWSTGATPTAASACAASAPSTSPCRGRCWPRDTTEDAAGTGNAIERVLDGSQTIRQVRPTLIVLYRLVDEEAIPDVPQHAAGRPEPGGPGARRLRLPGAGHVRQPARRGRAVEQADQHRPARDQLPGDRRLRGAVVPPPVQGGAHGPAASCAWAGGRCERPPTFALVGSLALAALGLAPARAAIGPPAAPGRSRASGWRSAPAATPPRWSATRSRRRTTRGEPVQAQGDAGFTRAGGVPTSQRLVVVADLAVRPRRQAQPLLRAAVRPPAGAARRAGRAGPGRGRATPEITAAQPTSSPTARTCVVGVEGLAGAGRPGGRLRRLDGHRPLGGRRRRAAHALTATFGHGLPFVYFEASGGAAVVDLPQGRRGGGVRRAARAPWASPSPGGPTALFAPARRHLDPATGDRRLRSDLRGRRYFSVAAAARRPPGHPGPLPQARLRLRHRGAGLVALRRAARRAAHHLRLSRPASATAAPALRDRAAGGAVPAPVEAPGPRPRRAPATPRPRGPMKLLAGDQLRDPAAASAGVLPVLPSARRAAAASTRTRWPRRCGRPPGPTICSPRAWTAPGARYWTGKSLRTGRAAGLAGRPGRRDRGARRTWSRRCKRVLEDWFDGADARTCSTTTGPGPR